MAKSERQSTAVCRNVRWSNVNYLTYGGGPLRQEVREVRPEICSCTRTPSTDEPKLQGPRCRGEHVAMVIAQQHERDVVPVFLVAPTGLPFNVLGEHPFNLIHRHAHHMTEYCRVCLRYDCRTAGCP